MRTLRLVNINWIKIDDTSKPTETLLTVDNGKFHGFGPESMSKIKSNTLGHTLFRESGYHRS